MLLLLWKLLYIPLQGFAVCPACLCISGHAMFLLYRTNELIPLKLPRATFRTVSREGREGGGGSVTGGGGGLSLRLSSDVKAWNSCLRCQAPPSPSSSVPHSFFGRSMWTSGNGLRSSSTRVEDDPRRDDATGYAAAPLCGPACCEKAANLARFFSCPSSAVSGSNQILESLCGEYVFRILNYCTVYLLLLSYPPPPLQLGHGGWDRGRDKETTRKRVR